MFGWTDGATTEKGAARLALVACLAMTATLTPLGGAIGVSHAPARAQSTTGASASSSTASSAAGPACPQGTVTPTTSPSPTAASNITPCPTATGSTASQSPSRSPAGSAAQQSRTISLFASDVEVTTGDGVDFAGQIVAAAPDCSGADQFVRLRRRMEGSAEFENFRATLTKRDGRFSFSDVRITYTSEYVAVAPAHGNCGTGQSPTVRVAAHGRVSIGADDETPERGTVVRITGRVRPKEPNSKVRLQQHRGGGWETVLGARLDLRSRYVFEFEAVGPKTQRYRVRWLGSDRNEPGTSELLTLELHR